MRRHLSDLGLFVLRFSAGCMILTHGIPKLVNFETKVVNFPDPIGLGSETSLMLATGAEVGCALLLIFGLFTRIAAVPLLITMGAAVVHHLVVQSDPFRSFELPLLYAAVFCCIALAGPGSPSIDRAISTGMERFRTRKQRSAPKVPPVPKVPPRSPGGYVDPDQSSEDVNLSDWESPKAM